MPPPPPPPPPMSIAETVVSSSGACLRMSVAVTDYSLPLPDSCSCSYPELQEHVSAGGVGQVQEGQPPWFQEFLDQVDLLGLSFIFHHT